jgi:hypothetical protein
MSDSLLSTITSGKVKRHIYMALFGLDGVGKTTFASQAPSPIFVGTEAGTFQLDVARFPKASTFEELLGQLDALLLLKHDYKTVVVDTLDWLEPLIWAQVCGEDHVESIETYKGGFGKGCSSGRTLALFLFFAIENLRPVSCHPVSTPH